LVANHSAARALETPLVLLAVVHFPVVLDEHTARTAESLGAIACDRPFELVFVTNTVTLKGGQDN
jgi:hypothetical protein